jgi:serine/threonine protein kinase
VTHTDLKPENLLIASDSQLKICDFGMAQRASPGTMWAVTGELSTLWYRAPELLLGCKTFGEKIDEWAVGCIAMEMLCGVTIFQGQQHGACQCRELTHRNFNSDQVGKILQVVGSPLSLAGYQCAGHIKDWPKYSRQIEPVVSATA